MMWKRGGESQSRVFSGSQACLASNGAEGERSEVSVVKGSSLEGGSRISSRSFR